MAPTFFTFRFSLFSEKTDNCIYKIRNKTDNLFKKIRMLTFTAELTKTVTGVHDLIFVFVGEGYTVDYWQFQ